MAGRQLAHGGVVDWFLTKLPSWLGGGAHWAGFSWTNAALPAYALITVLVVWTGFPFIAVSVLAGLRTIPDELHESARVDGGGPWRIFWLVTYPLLKPIFLVLLLLSIIWDFGVFTQVYIIIIIGGVGQRRREPLPGERGPGRGGRCRPDQGCLPGHGRRPGPAGATALRAGLDPGDLRGPWAAGNQGQAKGLPPASARHPVTAAHRIR